MLQNGGRLSYLTIVVTPGLSDSEHREAVRLGPRAVEASAPDAELMQRAGFTDVRVADVTSSFLETARSWRAEFSRREADIKQLIGEKEWEERQSNRIALVRAIEKGSLRRLLVTGGTV